ncbi:MAG: hypothetical protein GF417_05445 [Candidatus Latescibacteria bacterium]|nr:hypothetical protein [bacterium]MBD3423860.1 hypothetical protein [Candidatus Latescibacterota bacterium]
MDYDIKSPGMLLEDEYIRTLYYDFCRELLKLSDDIEAETTLFEVRFSGVSGMYINLSVYRELFIVSAGRDEDVKIRVMNREGLVKALHLSVKQFLETLSPETVCGN